jgi:hypothetical protein
MQNENNIENQGQKNVKQNPSRFNTNVNQGQDNDKNFNKQDQNRSTEINSGGLDRDEIDLDRSGVGTSDSNQKGQLNAGGATGANQQNQQAQTQQPRGPQQNQQQNQQQQGQQQRDGSANVNDEGMNAGSGASYGNGLGSEHKQADGVKDKDLNKQSVTQKQDDSKLQ